MRRFLPPAFALFITATVVAQSPPVSPAHAYVEKWIAAPDQAGTYTGILPRFRFTDHLAAAIADHDQALVNALLPLLREAHECEVTLLRLELGAAR